MANGPICSMIILRIALFIILGVLSNFFWRNRALSPDYVLMQTGTSVRVY